MFSAEHKVCTAKQPVSVWHAERAAGMLVQQDKHGKAFYMGYERARDLRGVPSVVKYFVGDKGLVADSLVSD